MGVAPRRLWGWEPETRLVPEGDGFRVEREPEFDKEQYELLAALVEYEQSVDEFGFPLEESTSVKADPLNPDSDYMYEARPIRLWSKQALVDAQNDPRWSGENYNPARHFVVEKVAR